MDSFRKCSLEYLKQHYQIYSVKNFKLLLLIIKSRLELHLKEQPERLLYKF